VATALEWVRRLAPELSSVSDTLVGYQIDAATEILLPSAWGTVYPQALARWAAHELTLQARRARLSGTMAGTGPVTSVSTGGMSIGYGSTGRTATNATEADWGTTAHGQALLTLRDSRAASGPLLLT
jgi:hypothetical protein